MLKYLNDRVKRLDVFDIGLIKWTVLFTGILVAKLFPQLLHLRYSALLVIIVILAIKPTYRYFLGK